MLVVTFITKKLPKISCMQENNFTDIGHYNVTKFQGAVILK